MKYVCGFAFTEEMHHGRSLILIEKVKPEWQRGLLNGVGGKIEVGEAPITAMMREFKEETSVATVREDWHKFHFVRFPSGAQVHFYASMLPEDVWHSAKTMEEEQVKKFTVQSLIQTAFTPPAMMYNLKYLIPMAMNYLDHPTERYLEG
jgi:8-oxo-dGTP diphosphatase